ncbi:MAG: HlyD family efflux transporter periplasmic adaptor subunit [Elusimicrobiota bacterium]|nr:HlyD family efflux transporter periplasmic adaptor subunit [Elusimicrobiota bacterium]
MSTGHEDDFGGGPLSRALTRTPKALTALFGVWAAAAGSGLAFVALMPWTQSVSGTGAVTAFSPMQRPQTVNAEIDGRLVEWKVHEGQSVAAGQVLAELAEMKPEYIDPAMESRVNSQAAAARLKRDAARAQLAAHDALIAALRRIGRAHLPSEELRGLRAPRELDDSGRRLVEAEQQSVLAARANLERVEALHAQGLRSTRDLELARRELAKAEGDIETKLLDAELKRAGALEKLGGLESDLLKAETEAAKLGRRGEQRLVRAPVDGSVVRLFGMGAGHVFKSGDPMAVVAPDTRDQAVELFISDHDAPLIAVGRPVRLQFAGWPALQMSGWPSVAVGTFAGRVAVVDASNDGRGRFRLLVRPDRDAESSGRDAAWPPAASLRAGSQAVGWVLLDRVPLWFELWRRFNGFPPSITPPSGSGGGKG